MICKKEESGSSILIIAQDEVDAHLVAQLQQGVVSVRDDRPDGQVRLRLMPDLRALMRRPEAGTFDDKSDDDLLTMAVTQNIPVKKGTLRGDLLAILDLAKSDLEAAKSLASKARPARTERRNQDLTPGAQGGSFSVNTVSRSM